MKNYLIKYFLEFVVIVVGISLSFYVEKQNAIAYKDELKNQSLSRILKNIEVDTKDANFNLEAHREAIAASDWVLDRKDRLLAYSRDSIGYHLGLAMTIATLFVDNQEEYRGLQNSGLIELIENEEVVVRLQNKYSAHSFYKEIEKTIIEYNTRLSDYGLENLRYNSNKTTPQGYFYDRTYTGTSFKIPSKIIELLKEKKNFHGFYIDRIQSRVVSDSILKILIEKEIQ